MTNETRQLLLDALLSCRAIRGYTAEIDFAAYKRDDMVRDAVERRLGIIGEALNRATVLEPALANDRRFGAVHCICRHCLMSISRCWRGCRPRR